MLPRMGDIPDLPKADAATGSIQKPKPMVLRILAGWVAAAMMVGIVISLVEHSGWADIRDAFIFALLSYAFGGYALEYINPRWHRKE